MKSLAFSGKEAYNLPHIENMRNMEELMKKSFLSMLMIAALMLTLCACGGTAPAESETPAAAEIPVQEDDGQIIVSEATEEDSGRQDGERFTSTIMLEGMEETVNYEHVKNTALGYELDYEYESLERRGDGESECFLSREDDPQDPWNYLEIRYDTGNANLVTDALKATLSGAYDTVSAEDWTLENAGECLRIYASGAEDGSLQTVYVIPSGDGCLVATAHCTYESAEGFGGRFNAMMNTLTVIARG